MSEPQVSAPVGRVYRLRPGRTAWHDVDGEAVVLDIEQSVYLGTNASGGVLWRALAEGATRSQLGDALIENFDVDEPTAVEAVDSFVDACTQRDLLEP